MSFTVTMPQLGETVTEGTILRWAKQPGDSVVEDEVLVEISTDKVDTEVPSPAAGVLTEIIVPEGETVAVGAALAVITAAGESTAPVAAAAAVPDAAIPVAPAPAPAPVPTPAPVAVEVESLPAVPAAAGADLGMLSPVVRKLAAQHGIDLATVPGTGRDGRITRKDVQAAVDAGTTGASAAAPAPVPVSVPAPAAAPDPASAPTPVPAPAPTPAAVPVVDAAAYGIGPRGIPLRPGDRVEAITRLRKRIADNMIEARSTAAHVWTLVEVDFERVEQVRRVHKASYQEAEGFSLTYLPFIARATIDALRAYPAVNSAFFQEEEERVLHERVDLGIAVDLDQEGLIVMTVRGAEQMRMRSLSREIRRVAGTAHSGEYGPDDVTGSTFTITNPGPFGSLMSAPVINVPNVAILSTDAVVKRPVAVTDTQGMDAIAIHHVGNLGLTWDHRAFDGSTAVLFLRHIKDALENWDWEHELS